MKIERILNNNAIVSRDANGEEVIVKGKGIAFQAAAGDKVDEKRIEKVFILETKEANSRYHELLNSVPADCIEISEQVIEAIKEEVHKEISDKIYITLTDHIVNLLERLSLGINFDNGLLWDVRRMYPAEYKAAAKAAKIIEKGFDITVPDEEASFIALHIVNAEMNVEFEDVYKITGMIDEISSLVEEQLGVAIDKESLEYSRFVVHLRFFLERMLNPNSTSNQKNTEVLDIMAKQYFKEYECVLAITDFVSQKWDRPVKGEALYLLIHVVKLTGH